MLLRACKWPTTVLPPTTAIGAASTASAGATPLAAKPAALPAWESTVTVAAISAATSCAAHACVFPLLPPTNHTT